MAQCASLRGRRARDGKRIYYACEEFHTRFVEIFKLSDLTTEEIELEVNIR